MEKEERQKMSKKKNPIVHLRQSDVRKMKDEATNQGLKGGLIIFFSVMRDKEGYGPRKRLPRLYKHMTDLADSIKKGYVKLEDLEQTLKDEANIVFDMD